MNDVVVVDSVLCYVINKRGRLNDEEIKFVVENHFNVDEIDAAYDLLNKYSTNFADVDEFSANSATAKIDAILRILNACEENRRSLPKFAAVDINNLPTPSGRNADAESATNFLFGGDGETNNNNNKNNNTDRMLLTRILQELKNLKEMVERFGDVRPLTSNGRNSQNSKSRRTPSPTVNVTVLSSPAPSTDDPSPTDSVGGARSGIGGTTGRKRGNSRGTNSIEDAVAKIKAIRSDPTPIVTTAKSEPHDTSYEQEVDDAALLNCSTSSSGQGQQHQQNQRQQQLLSPLQLLNRSVCSTSSAVVAPPPIPSHPLFPVPPALLGISSYSLPPYFDILTSSLIPPSPASTTAVVNVVDASPPKRESPSTTRLGAGGRPSSSSSLNKTFSSSSYPSVQKLTKQNNNSQKAVPSLCNGNGGGGSLFSSSLKSVELSSSSADNNNVEQLLSSSSGATTSCRVVGGNNGGGCGGGGDSSNDSTYKPYVCQHANCNKRFANKFLLKKHEFIHTGERPHQCTYCCKRFNRKDNLLRHKKTHEANYSLVRRRSRHLFGVTTTTKDPTTTTPSGERAASSESPPMSPKIASSSSDSGGVSDDAASETGTPQQQQQFQTNEDAALKFVRDMTNNLTAADTSFCDQQQVQLAAAAAAFKAYKATTAGLAAAFWSQASGISSDN